MKKRLLIVDEDSASNSMLMNHLTNSKWVEICGQATRIDQVWQMLQSLRPDMVLLGEIKESERGVLCQQFRFAFPHLSFIAACSPQDLVWEPFFRNLGIWVVAKPIQAGQIEALAMMPQAITREAWQSAPPQEPYSNTPSMPSNQPLRQTMGEASSESQSPAIHSMPKHLITVYGPKGGVGKTFISRELAIYFSQQKREGSTLKVLAVDFNLDLGTFATTLNLPRTPNMFTWVQEIEAQLHESVRLRGRDPADIRAEEWQEYIADFRLSSADVEKYIVTHVESGLHVLTSPRDIRHSFEIRNYHVYLILETLKHSTYDVILIDTAPDTTDATIQALFFAEQVVMVGNPVVDSIENIQRLLKLLREAEYPEERIQVCMNRLQRKEMFTLDEIRAYFQLHPSKKIFPIPDDAEVKKSINTGSPMMLQPGKTAAKGAIETLGKALIPEEEEKAESPLKNKTRERPALFRWLWG
ncbi:AAA family ATPase [Brevibacillus invocatus]|uniref:AAA family ATPase n=1 Tax=Brevibacillus invocatus TaxID=173959 RepID=UPI0020410FE7|nr:AAA family ATPase [Brevibacillus invocatus]MCM3081753.1 AAA family ATPase [Brevibacillus invocatus]MCM3432160.1 AAA family ATPase [Brevibacillus invocatus]